MSTFLVFTALTALLSSVSGLPVSSGPALSKRSYSGQATWYDPSGNPGACGWYNKVTDHVVALSSDVYQESYCGRYVTITYGSTTASGMVVDQCPTCAPTSLDLAQKFFDVFAPESVGVLQIQWDFE